MPSPTESPSPPGEREIPPKWSLYADKEDSFSPPLPQRHRKAKSKANPKPSAPVGKEDSSIIPPPESESGRPKAKSKALSKANSKSSGAPQENANGDNENPSTMSSGRPNEKIDSGTDTPQDGLGDPNLSGITPPLPMSLVEPTLRAYDTGFYVITSGVEVGITTVKGIAEMRLACQNPSSHTFSTWRQAASYYTICFNDGSVIIRPALQDRTPMQSPVRKKRKVTKLSERRPPPQPSFAPAFSTPKVKGSASHPISISSTDSTPAFCTPKVKGSASHPISISSTDSTPASHSTREYTPLYFPESPSVLSKLATSRKRPHAGIQAIPHSATNAASPSGQYPAPPIPGVTPTAQYPEQESLTPPPPDPSRSLGHIDPRYVFFESSSDEDAATHSNANSTPLTTRPRHINPRYVFVESSSDEDAATDSNANSAPLTARPGPSSSLIVEVHSDAPATYHASSPVIIISDSEEEPEPEAQALWPNSRTDARIIHELKMLFAP